MKKFILFISIFIFSQSLLSQVSFGGGLSVNTGSESTLGVRVLGAYDVDDSWKGQAAFSYFFGDWGIDLDAHYKLIEIGDYEGTLINPFAGLNIYKDKISGFPSDTEIGINLGINIAATIEEYQIFVEPKIVLGGIGSLVVSAGIMF